MLTPTLYKVGNTRVPGLLSPTHDRQPHIANMTFPAGAPGLAEGVVVVSRSGSQYLLGQARTILGGRQRFLAYPLVRDVAWESFTESVHPVTGLAGPRVSAGVEEVRMGYQGMGVLLHEGLSSDHFRYFTQHDVQVGDNLDGRQVRRVRREGGVNIVDTW
ncbi:hypothetical protein PU634_10330 [Oceanimonas pelagia]|uniref:Uncharacterized protein n=1 Tax=Oceanimonas pelagia TaxID=3028314 RepID=A0AA50KM96_9GAMM|nr:hypothetical protein [Oceanimonas pelagia]WMC09512.1 hypothetical protein PU634_10330 [Oceanimonas pelagia]